MASDMHAPALWHHTSLSLSVSACKCAQQAFVPALWHRLRPCRVLSPLRCIFSGLRILDYSELLFLHFTFCANSPLSEVTVSSVHKLESFKDQETAMLILPVCLPARLSVCLFVCLPARPPARPPAHPPGCLSVCLPACLLACLPACLSACLIYAFH